MKNVGNYQIIQKIGQTRSSIVYRAQQEDNSETFIIKELITRHPSDTDIVRFRQEYDLIRAAKSDGVVKVLDLVIMDGIFYLVLEDFKGISLKNLLSSERLTIKSFLKIAIDLAETLGRLHKDNLVHKDIKPDNILLNPETGEVKITDFGIYHVLTHEDKEIYNPEVIENTLHYISPEQTGRMNHFVDYRTDIYSLGISFYEMVTGSVPFTSHDPMEIMHSHIAIKAPSPHELKPTVPEMISRIIMKLLLKTPEERYQSGFGLKADLEECLRQLEEKGTISPFTPGVRDIPNRFIIPQKLVGREKEQEILLSCFEQDNKGAKKLLIVKGAPGIGKSAFINEVHKPIVAKRGYYIFGKYEQFRRDRPYSAIIQAFQGLIKRLLMESDRRIRQWKEDILATLLTNGKIITDIIPELELIIGPQPDVQELQPREARNRFNLVFSNFIRVFLKEEHPVALFLDDLQWSDLASLEFLKRLSTDAEIKHLYIVCSYRDNEVDENHPVSITLKEIEKSGLGITTITLDPLKEEDVTTFILNFISCKKEDASVLARIVHSKTGGNPFFINQFLKTTYEEKLITIDPAIGWVLDLENIGKMKVTDNIVTLMAQKISMLPEETLSILKVSAAIGNRFSLHVIAYIMNISMEKALSDLTVAMENGYVDYNHENNLYVFHHDRILEASYSLIPDDEKPGLHYKIGRLTMENTPESKLKDRLFYIVDHLNQGIQIVIEKKETIALARMNLEAGKTAKYSAAYSPSMRYLDMGISLLDADSWEKEYALTISLYTQCVEVSCLVGDYEKMERLSEKALEKATSLLDTVTIYSVKITAATAQEKLGYALNTGVKVSQLLGFPKEVNKLKIFTLYIKLKLKLLTRTDQQILDMHNMTDPVRLAALEYGSALGYTIFSLDPDLLALYVLFNIYNSLKHGLAPEHAHNYAAFASIIIAGFYDIKGGYHYGKLALQLAEREFSRKYRTQAWFIYNSLVRHWKEPLRNSIEPLMDAYKMGLENGDFFFGAFALNLHDFYRFAAGYEFTDLLASVEEHRKAIINLNQMHVLNQQNILWQVLLNITGKEGENNLGKLKGKALDEDVMVPQWKEMDNKTILSTYYTVKIVMTVFTHDYKEALICSDELEKYKESTQGSIIIQLLAFYGSIARLGLYPDASEKERKRYLRWVNKILRMMKHWIRFAPQNHLHRFHLIEAEKARILGENEIAQKNYDLAITLGHENKFLHEEAFANELSGRYYLSIGKKKLATHYLKEGYTCYSKGGVAVKTQLLKAAYPDLLTFDTELSSEALDIASVLKASQAISGEVVLGRLLGKMMKIIMETAGAEKGFIVLKQENALIVEAEGTPGMSDICELKSTPLDSHHGLSAAIVHYVARTKEILILNDASNKGAFVNDSYVVKNSPKSILCTPIINQTRLTGILYLENNNLVGAFTPQRVEMLNMFSSQIAISIENAMLYETLEDKINERTMALSLSEEKYRAIIENITDGYYEVDLKGALTFYNSAFCQIFGYGEEEFKGVSYKRYTSKETAEKIFKIYNLVYRTGKNEALDDWEIITKQETRKYVSVSISPIRDNKGDITGFRGITRDITARKRSEEALKELDRQKSTFLANISHEIRTPLTLILSPIEAVLQGDFTQKVDENFLVNLHRNAIRLLRLVNNLLDFSKIEAGKMGLKISEVDIVRLLKTYTSAVMSAIESKGVTFNFISTKDAIPLFMDIDKADKVVANLFSNAIKYTEEGERIELRIKEDDTHCYIEFEDTGMGIPEEKVGMIFDRFSQVDTGLRRGYGGTGIGLALVKEILEKHNGSITVKSRDIEHFPENHGTTFYITLPKGTAHLKGRPDVEFADTNELAALFSDADQYEVTGLREMRAFFDHSQDQERDPHGHADISKRNILIVEDNSEMRHFLEFLLKADFNVYTAPNGKDGFEKIRSLKPDLVITDVMMPIMNGYELTSKIKADEELKRIPVIMLTAKAEIAKKVKGLEYGADDYLTKPFNSRELIARVNSQLRIKHMQDELIELNSSLESKINIAVYDIVQREQESLDVLGSAAEFRDPETGGHILRVANYSSILSESIGLAEPIQELLFYASPLHDIGKLGIPDKILLKPGKLTAEEYEAMKKHCQIGYEILKNRTSKYLQAAAIIALSHHERFDGSGYPYALKGEEIHLYGRILAVIDVFDAISSKRIYKEAWPFDVSVNYILSKKGTDFDPLIVDSFAENLEKIEDVYHMYMGK